MAQWVQHLLVFAIVTACVAVVALQAVSSLRGKKSKLGSCCSKGCQPPDSQQPPANAKTERIHFLPVEMLSRKK